MADNPSILSKAGQYKGPEVIPPVLILDGAPNTESWSHAAIPVEGPMRYGIWQCQPGTIDVPSYPDDEIFTLTHGRVLLENADGSTLEIVPGQTCVLRRGWRGVWRTIESAQKAFVAIAPPPAKN